jgi:hypothetical protein
MTHDQIETAKVVGDGLSITTTVGALVGILPSLAALLSVIWTAIRIYEMPTVQKLIAKWRSGE